MKVVEVKDLKEANEKVYEVFCNQLKEKKNSVLGLATGSSPIHLYELLSKNKELDFSEVITFNLDEYALLDKNHPQSYYYFMHKHLFSNINVQSHHIHIPSGVLKPQEACDEYNDLLNQYTIDLQLLGMGSNGHIGFNEPGTSFDSITHFIELDESTRKDNARLFFNNNLDEVPTHAITMGIANIMKAKKIVLIACGANKAKALQKVIQGSVTIDIPASILQKHPDCTIYADQEALQLLK